MKTERTYTEFVESFSLTEIGMIVLVREAIWAHPDNAGLVRKLNLISFDWKRRYTKEELMEQVSNLLRKWSEMHNCRIKDISIAAHQRYYIENNGWISRKLSWHPYNEFKAVDR